MHSLIAHCVHPVSMSTENILQQLGTKCTDFLTCMLLFVMPGSLKQGSDTLVT